MANQDISLTSFDPQAAALQRQQYLAQMLTQQASDPIAINSGGGAQAAISPLAVLAKAFQGYAGSYLDKKALKDAGDLQANRRADLAKMLSQQFQTPGTPSQGVQMPGVAPVQTQIGGQSLNVGGAAPDPYQGAAGDGIAPRPTTPQEQMANALSMTGSGNPMAAQLGQQLYAQAAQRQTGREDKTWENAQPMPVARGQEIAASGAQAQQNALFANQLPATAAERAANALGYAQVNKPVAVGFGGQMYDPKSRQMFSPGGGGISQPTAIDPNSNSLNAQTGLSQLAIDRATGAPNQPRTASIVAKVDDELTKYSVANNVDLSTLRARASGINSVVTQNVMRNNQGNILENEISGSVQNLGPLLDQLHNGQIDKANVLNIWAGRQVNDPVAQQAADQLGRLRNELAGYNAVAGGHLMENGTPHPFPEDVNAATKTIMDGINSGGVRAVAESVGMSAKKNRAVLANALDDARHDLWDAFGKGKNYKRTSPPLDGSGGPPPPATGAKTVVRTGTDKATGKKVVQYSDGTTAYAP